MELGSSILRETRWLAVIIIPFLALAFAILYGFPTQTARLFAWEIKPPMTAMMLGAVYLGGVWFFGRATRAARWTEIATGFPAVGAFASILGIATLLHWDRFIHDSLAFILWTILYLTTPFLVLGTWWRQQRLEAGRPAAASVSLPGGVRMLFAGIGVAMIAVSVGLFVAPTNVGAAWPWPLTPLTTRVMSAMFALPALVGIGIGLDGRWSGARIIVEAQVLAVALIVAAPVLHPDGIDWGSPLAWVLFGGLGGLAVFLAGLYVSMERLSRTARPG
jgi:hypothetical protein